jgi:ABC-2 type transport system permease protein
MSDDNANGAPPSGHYGEVFDRGYTHYTGERLGRKQAFRSLVGYSMKRAMGIRKSWTAKVLPFLLYAAAAVPLVIMIGVSALVPDAEFASYSDYLAAIFVIVGIFVATTAPEMLCGDRREGALPLYFARAIARFDYVLAKVVAMTLLTMTLSLAPLIILWFGRQLVSDSPGQAMRDNVGDLGRVVFAGALIALVLGTIGLAISSFTDRKGVAVAVIITGFLIGSGIANAGLVLLEDYDWSRYLILFSILDTFEGIYDHIIHDNVTGSAIAQADLSLQVYLGYVLSLVVIGIFILRWRYSPRDES